jgi:hypothetical protein
MSKRFGKKRGPGCTCTEDFTCGLCLKDAGPRTAFGIFSGNPSDYTRGDRVVVNSGHLKAAPGKVLTQSMRTRGLTVFLDAKRRDGRDHVVNVMPYEVQREEIWKQTHPQEQS